MQQKIFLLMIVMACGRWPAAAQFTDSFTDGDFRSAPAWHGDDLRFVISSERLRLQAPAQTGVSSLVTESSAVHEASWSFTVQLDFTPSSANQAKVYLMSDQPALGGPLNGYFVKVGNTTREVSLYRQSGTVEHEVIDGLDDRVNQGIVNIGVRVTRNGEGNWELFTDVNRLGVFTKEGEAIDVEHTISRWFGVQCMYTSTRSDKFWFDDFVVHGTRVPDTTPPEVVRVNAPDPNHVIVEFSEPIDPREITGSILLGGIGHPVSAEIGPDSMRIELELPVPMVNGLPYSLNFSGVMDRSGNRLLTTIPIMYFNPGKPSPKSVIITEIFPDPAPQVGLPAAEYIELYNRADEPFDLNDWKLTDGSSTGVLGAAILRPREYITLTSTGSLASFGDRGVTGLSNFPSLNNSGDRLWLVDDKGVIIDSVSYSLSWFRDEDKQEGGWSLELIDLDNPCGEEANWTASEDSQGGTPGRTNSVIANKPDLTSPNMLAIWQPDSTRLIVSFDELLQQPARISVRLEPEISLADISLHGEARRELEIRLNETLLRRTTYTLHLSGIRDCMGNVMEDSAVDFGVTEPADSGDILISEVLFNPRPGGADFVEVHNVSEKFIGLEGWHLGNGPSANPLPRFLIHPGQWVAFSEDPQAVIAHYPSSNAHRVIRADVPSLPDNEGEVVLTNPGMQLIDQLDYQAGWHSVFLKDDDGVSLERIDYTRGTQLRDNWISASSHEGYATPGRANSQHRNAAGGNENVDVIPTIFCPGTSPADFVQIHYCFDLSGGVANIKVYNHGGSVIKSIAENAWLGHKGFFRWDGDRSDGQRAAAGYYFIWFEWFDANGRVETYRKRVIVAAR